MVAHPSVRYNYSMVAAIKQLLTVQHDGRLEIRAPELRAGEQAEVIVLVQPQGPAKTLTPLEALDALQRSLRLDQKSADAWMQQVRAERDVSGPSGE